MNNAPGTDPVYVKCQRCGAQIPEQSAIEENGELLCGKCLVSDVKRDVSKAEAKAEEQRHQERIAQREQMHRQQRRRALLILAICVSGLIIAMGLAHMNRSDPAPTQKLTSAEHPDIVKSMLLIGIYKYKSEHGNPPETLKDLVPEYLNAELSGALGLFEYAVEGDESYTLNLKNTPAATGQQDQHATQGDEL